MQYGQLSFNFSFLCLLISNFKTFFTDINIKFWEQLFMLNNFIYYEVKRVELNFLFNWERAKGDAFQKLNIIRFCTLLLKKHILFKFIRWVSGNRLPFRIEWKNEFPDTLYIVSSYDKLRRSKVPTLVYRPHILLTGLF